MEKFKSLIREMIHFFDEIIELYERKQVILKENRLFRLEELLNEEQVLVLKMKGFEKRRKMLMKSMGKEDLSFRELIFGLEGEEKQEMRRFYDELNSKLNVFQTLKASAESQLEINMMDLHLNLIREQKKERELQSESTGTGSFTSMKV